MELLRALRSRGVDMAAAPAPAHTQPARPAAQMKQQVPRSRPTNNQLLYKAHFRWAHYGHRQIDTSGLETETDPCASVTAAFLKVLSILHRVETACVPKRNILQLLAHNTRRTKVLELSSGTHRIPEELKKHFLTDEHGAQYSTNLDRNRYGSDNNYLFTVIKHDLETLGLCPCLVDVEIIDAKAHGDSQLVNAAAEACICGGIAAAPASMPPPQPQPQPQGECSQLFEALVAAAADATAEQAEADTAAQDGHVANSRLADHNVVVTNGVLPASVSPGRRRPPGRVTTGIFSVNSSDLMGYGLSNLGNSGLVMGGSLDLKDEVEQQRPSVRRKRSKLDVDTISEQGDTDRYLKNMAIDGEDGARAPRRGYVPRQNSKVVTHEGAPVKDVRGLWLELQTVQQQQAQLELSAERQKRSHVECEALISQLQRGIQALQEDRVQLKGSVETLESRVHVLESTVLASSQQVASLRELLVRALSKGQGAEVAAAEVAAAAADLPTTDPSKNVLFQDHHQQQQQRQAGGKAPNGATGDGAGAAPGGVPMAQSAAALHLMSAAAGGAPGHATAAGISAAPAGAAAGEGRDQMAMPPTMADVAVLPARLNPAGAAHGSLDQLAPIAQLQHTGNRSRNDSSLQKVQEPLEGLDTVKFDDSEAIKKLPKFDNFGSLSDLGSLFSGGGAGRSLDVRASGRQPPTANLSITSPHPMLKTAKAAAAVEHPEEGVAATAPSTAV